MSLIGSTLPISANTLRPTPGVGPARDIGIPQKPAGLAPSGEGFGDIFTKLVDDVETAQAKSAEVTRSVLIGENPNLHQSVIAMQEASVSFSLMVEVRNKVVEGYQELMRMPV